MHALANRTHTPAIRPTYTGESCINRRIDLMAGSTVHVKIHSQIFYRFIQHTLANLRLQFSLVFLGFGSRVGASGFMCAPLRRVPRPPHKTTKRLTTRSPHAAASQHGPHKPQQDHKHMIYNARHNHHINHDVRYSFAY